VRVDALDRGAGVRGGRAQERHDARLVFGDHLSPPRGIKERPRYDPRRP
jgi:hypothetical protein